MDDKIAQGLVQALDAIADELKQIRELLQSNSVRRTAKHKETTK